MGHDSGGPGSDGHQGQGQEETAPAEGDGRLEGTLDAFVGPGPGEHGPHGDTGRHDGLGEHVEQVVSKVVLGQSLRLPQVGQEETVGLEGDRDGQGLQQLGSCGVDDAHAAHAAQARHVPQGTLEQRAGGAPGDDDADDRHQGVGDVGVDGHGVAAPQSGDDGQQQEAGHGRGDDPLTDDLGG